MLKKVSLAVFFVLLLSIDLKALPRKIPLSEKLLDSLILINTVIDGKKTRMVYKDPYDNSYFKIWCKEYSLAPHFLEAVESGFYNDIACIEKLIFDQDDLCRGYVMPEGVPALNFPQLLETFREKFLRFAPNKAQTSQSYDDFYTRILIATQNTGYVYIDFTPSNVVLIDDLFYLIDLESVRKIGSINNHFFKDEHLPRDYREDIKRIKISNN